MVPPRVRRAALLAGALLLVFNPFYVDGVLHVDDPNRYEYHAEPLRFHADGHPNVSAGVPALADDEEVGCLLGDGRACAFERYVLRHGPVTVRSDPGWSYDGTDEYVFLNGSFYRPRAEPAGDDPPRERLSLERVPRETALEAVATPFHEASSGARTAITEGPVTRRRALPDARTIVAHDGEYYVVYAKYGRFLSGETFAERRDVGNIVEGVVSALGVLVGLRLLTTWVASVE